MPRNIQRRKIILKGLCLPMLGLLPSAWAKALQTSQAVHWLPPKLAKLTYAMNGHWNGPISGRGSINWQCSVEKQMYALDLNISTFLLSFLYQSKGLVDSQIGLIPYSYREKRIGRDRTVLLNHETRQITYDWKKGASSPLPDGVQDTTSVIMQMAYLIANYGDTMKVGQEFPFSIARMGSVKYWTFTLIDQPVLKTKAGSFKTWHVSRLSPAGGADKDLRVEFWLAPDLHYLPLQIAFNMKNEAYLQVTLAKVKEICL